MAGLDGDPAILALPRDKAEAENLAVEFREGLAMDPPFSAQSFDRVVSSLRLVEERFGPRRGERAH